MLGVAVLTSALRVAAQDATQGTAGPIERAVTLQGVRLAAIEGPRFSILTGQDGTSAGLAVGARVRVTTMRVHALSGRSSGVIGVVTAVEEPRLSLIDERGAAMSFTRSEVSGIELSAGRVSRGRDAAFGLAIGGVLGALMMAAVASDCTPAPFAVCIQPSAAALGGAVLFGGIGAAVGAAIRPPERWTPLRLGRQRFVSESDAELQPEGGR